MTDDTISYGKRDETFRDAITRLLSIGLSDDEISYLLVDKNMSYFSTAFTHESANSNNNQNFLRTIGHFSYQKTLIWYISRNVPNIFTKDGQKIATIIKNNIAKYKKLGEFINTFFKDFLQYLTISTSILSHFNDEKSDKYEILEELCEAIFGAIEFLLDEKRQGLGNALLYQLTVSIFEKYIKLNFDSNIDNIKDTKTKINEIFMNNKVAGRVEYKDMTSSTHLDEISLYAIELHQVFPNNQSFLIGRGSDIKKINAEQKAALNALFTIKNKGLLSYNFMSRQYFTTKLHSLENEPILSSSQPFISVQFRRIFNDKKLFLDFQKIFNSLFDNIKDVKDDEKTSIFTEINNAMVFDISDQKMIQFIQTRINRGIRNIDMTNMISFIQTIK